MSDYRKRKSGMELLKVIGTFLIVFNHIMVLITRYPAFGPYTPKIFINIHIPSTDIVNMILQFIMYFGQFGNIIFTICASWYLLDYNSFNKKRVFELLITNWLISAIFTTIYIISPVEIDTYLIFRSLLPDIYCTYWFVTCFILFYIIRPYLNRIINSLDQKTYLRIDIFLIIKYIFVQTIFREAFYSNTFIIFIVFHFIISYIKRYMPDFQTNTKLNVILLITSIVCIVICIVGLDILGLHIPFLYDKMLRLQYFSNPFVLLSGISLFNILNNMDFYSDIINRLSNLSLYTYLIHFNNMFIYITRYKIIRDIFDRYGKDNVLMKVFVLTIVTFVFSIVAAYVYKLIFEKQIKNFAVVSAEIYEKIIDRISSIIIKIS